MKKYTTTIRKAQKQARNTDENQIEILPATMDEILIELKRIAGTIDKDGETITAIVIVEIESNDEKEDTAIMKRYDKADRQPL